MSDFLPTAIQLARAAGAILREGYGQVQSVELKGAIDPVTIYDRRAEEYLTTTLRRMFPNHALFAEESGRSAAGDEYEWIIDPLDGTMNFAHGFPAFCVSLALARRGQVRVGVVYDPLRDELFAAEAGQGATLNGRPLRVSAETDLGHALLATGFAYDVRTNPHNNLAEFGHFQLRARGVRRAGSAALDCVYVAAGRLDGYWELGIQPWDVAAGALITQEAGGQVTTVTGEPYALATTRAVLFSNGHLHAQMLRVLREGEAAPRP